MPQYFDAIMIMEDDARLSLFATRVQFDELVRMFPNIEHHLVVDASIHNVITLEGGCKKDLTSSEKLQCF